MSADWIFFLSFYNLLQSRLQAWEACDYACNMCCHLIISNSTLRMCMLGVEP